MIRPFYLRNRAEEEGKAKMPSGQPFSSTSHGKDEEPKQKRTEGGGRGKNRKSKTIRAKKGGT